MSTWIIYPSPKQDRVKEDAWRRFEQALEASGLRVEFDKAAPGAVIVRDPREVLSEGVKGYDRRCVLERRVARLIKGWRKEFGDARG